MLKVMRIETERLILRTFKESDYDDLYEYLSQLENDEFEGYPSITYENGKEHLMYRVESEEFYAIELKNSGKVIGNIYFGNRDFFAKEIGYIVNKNYQRCGYASEAIRGVLEHAFKHGVHRVYAECDPRNTCSWKLLEKVSFKREAHFRKNIYFHKDENGMPIWKDTYVYAMCQDDYPYAMSKNDCEYATYKEQAGMKKKSFELNYNGGTIWCEHLDSMGNMEAEVIKKFEEDSKTFCRPSVSSYMIINLDETTITQQIVACIANRITACEKKFMKLAFVGVGRTEQKQFEKMMKQSGIVVSYLKDYEKAKEWVLG